MTDPKTLAEEIAARHVERTELANVIETKTQQLRLASMLVDRGIRRGFQATYDDAAAKRQTLESELADTESRLRAIEAAWNAGDESIGSEAAATLTTSIKRLTGLLRAAERSEAKARRELDPWLSDDHLSHLGGEIIAPHTSAPIFHNKRPQDAPDISPAIILSQTTPTTGYGTIEVSGDVAVTLIGEPQVDWRAVRRSFEDEGCDADVTESHIRFDRATWSLPRLTEPDGHAVARFSNLFERAWKSRIEVNETADVLAAAGYNVPATAFGTGLTALSRRGRTDLSFNEGTAEGTAEFTLGIARGGRGSDIVSDDLRAEVEALIETFRAASIGNVTEAGEITNIELVSAERGDGSAWGRGATYGLSGHALYPATLDVSIRLNYIYEPAQSAGIVIADD